MPEKPPTVKGFGGLQCGVTGFSVELAYKYAYRAAQRTNP